MRLFPAFILFLCAGGCSDSRSVMDELPNSSIAGAAREDMPETRIEGALARPVTIGEDGQRLDACGALGAVRGPGTARTLDLRAAPFAEAKPIAALPEGTRVHICTRSIDQRWLGVVVQPAPAPPPETMASNVSAGSPVDCGVSAPVERKRAYEGPCQSGWVAAAFVQMVAL
ncbi:hypothetical protein BH10PSE12_BH10PSE12_35290 [soil metagenome]